MTRSHIVSRRRGERCFRKKDRGSGGGEVSLSWVSYLGFENEVEVVVILGLCRRQITHGIMK